MLAYSYWAFERNRSARCVSPQRRSRYAAAAATRELPPRRLDHLIRRAFEPQPAVLRRDDSSRARASCGSNAASHTARAACSCPPPAAPPPPRRRELLHLVATQRALRRIAEHVQRVRRARRAGTARRGRRTPPDPVCTASSITRRVTATMRSSVVSIGPAGTGGMISGEPSDSADASRSTIDGTRSSCAVTSAASARSARRSRRPSRCRTATSRAPSRRARRPPSRRIRTSARS